MYQSSYPAASSLHRRPLQGVVQTSTLAVRHQRVSEAHLHLDAALHSRAGLLPQATTEVEGSLIPTDQEVSRARGPHGDIEPALDPSLPAPAPLHEDAAVDVTALGRVAEAGEEGARATVATAVMMIGAGAEAVAVGDGEGAENGLFQGDMSRRWYYTIAMEFGMAGKMEVLIPEDSGQTGYYPVYYKRLIPVMYLP